MELRGLRGRVWRSRQQVEAAEAEAAEREEERRVAWAKEKEEEAKRIEKWEEEMRRRVEKEEKGKGRWELVVEATFKPKGDLGRIRWQAEIEGEIRRGMEDLPMREEWEGLYEGDLVGNVKCVFVRDIYGYWNSQFIQFTEEEVTRPKTDSFKSSDSPFAGLL